MIYEERNEDGNYYMFRHDERDDSLRSAHFEGETMQHTVTVDPNGVFQVHDRDHFLCSFALNDLGSNIFKTRTTMEAKIPNSPRNQWIIVEILGPDGKITEPIARCGFVESPQFAKVLKQWEIDLRVNPKAKIGESVKKVFEKSCEK